MESEMKTKTKKGVTLLVEALKNEGVEVLFGYPGGAVLHIYDEFYKSESNHVLTRPSKARSMQLTVMPVLPANLASVSLQADPAQRML